MRASPSIRTAPAVSVAAAVRKRTEVPEFPSQSVSAGAVKRPEVPRTCHSAGLEVSITHPRALNASHMTRVSSLSRPPRSRLSPLARAATRSARFVMLFEPGTLTRADRLERVAIGRQAGRAFTKREASTGPAWRVLPLTPTRCFGKLGSGSFSQLDPELSQIFWSMAGATCHRGTRARWRR